MLGKAFGRQWAFIALERIGGVMVYEVTIPSAARYVGYVNSRDFSVVPNAANIPPKPSPNTGDLSPEALVFIRGKHSPNGKPLLVMTNELSGTTTILEITRE